MEAILRAVEGQRQWRKTIDALAAAWLDEHQTQSSDAKTLRRDPSLEPAIAIAAAQLLWDQSDWPRGAMAQTHWLRLAEILVGTEPAQVTLPAGIEVVTSGSEVTLNRRTGDVREEADRGGDHVSPAPTD